MDSYAEMQKNVGSYCKAVECKTAEVFSGKESPKEIFSEDFIIIENPDFSLQPHISSQDTPGVETDFLPPPRTLDDAPIRGPRRKGKRPKNIVGVRKNAPQSSIMSFNEELIAIENPEGILPSIALSQLSSYCQSENEVEIKPPIPSPQILDETHSGSIVEWNRDNQNGLEDRRSASYNLRKKSVSVDYGSDSLLLDNEEAFEAKLFICLECQVCCATKKELNHHQVTMHDYKLHQCEECGNDFNTALGLRKHIFLKHSQSKCSLCNKKFKVGQRLVNHLKVCGAQSTSKTGRNFQKPKYFPCRQCGRKFSERGNLRRHIRIHQGLLNFSCDLCGKKCSEKQALDSHIRYMHTGERPYKCDKCPKTFATNSDWNRHQSVHTDERKFLCSDCGKSFKTREALKAHVKFKSGEKLWQCGVCDQRFITKGGLKTHMVVHSSIKMFECETCQRKFSHKGSLEAHMRVHTGLMPYVCPKCGKKFAHLQNRNRHVRTMHIKIA